MSAAIATEALCPTELAFAYKFSTAPLLPLSPDHSGGTIFDYSKLLAYVANTRSLVSGQTAAQVQSLTADSTDELSKKVSTSVETEASASFFSASAKAEYGVSSSDYSERHYAQISEFYRVATVSFPSPSTDLAALRDLFTASFLQQLDALSSEDEAKEFFATVGTHFVQSVTLGGLHKYSATSVKTKTTSTEDIMTSLSASATGFGVTGSVKTTISVTSSSSHETYSASVVTTCVGGNPLVVADASAWRESLATHPGIIDFAISPIYKLVSPSDKARYAMLKKATEDVLLALTCDVEVKRVTGKFLFNDGGSGAKMDLACYGHFETDWYMLGHGYSEPMVVVKKGPLVKPATGWRRIWNDQGSGKDKDYDAYIPTCDDPQYVAMGVVYVFGFNNHPEPPAGLPVALVHECAVGPTYLDPSDIAWEDRGTGARYDLRVLRTPLGTTWPSIATMLGTAPPQFFCLRKMP